MVMQERTRGDESEDPPNRGVAASYLVPSFPSSARDFFSLYCPDYEPTVLEIRNLGFDWGTCQLEQRTL